MGIGTKYLQLVAATTFAFSMASDAGRTTMAITRESGATTDISEAQSGLPGDSTVSGIVKLAGPQPVATHISMGADPACLKAHPAPVMSEEVVTGASGALKNVIVYISDGLGHRAFEPPKEPPYLSRAVAVTIRIFLECKPDKPSGSPTAIPPPIISTPYRRTIGSGTCPSPQAHLRSSRPSLERKSYLSNAMCTPG